ncbi:MAG TPA: response regulator [Candidatus Saccharimonadales bacterium]|jgi:two-component system cell cycle response regulator|nr:response regulator [Candidatus Saccharimonadales bacterium]
MAKILLIEDDELIRRLYENLFTLEDFEIEIAENGLTGWEMIPHFKPDIILLDIMMPTMNGLEMLEKIKADPLSSHIPVIVLTNVSDTNIAHQATEKGAVLVLIKSQTEPTDVLASVKGVLAKNEAA